ncbi:hypothetical protein ADK65_08990 [Streptomyces sp. NRRL B-1140]|nr:hypothetical protein ADK65_08990 [Streptomyces sp. NRRL B-1140]
MHVHVRLPGDRPPVQPLLDRLRGRIPDGVPIVVDDSRRQRADAGRVGDRTVRRSAVLPALPQDSAAKHAGEA